MADFNLPFLKWSNISGDYESDNEFAVNIPNNNLSVEFLCEFPGKNFVQHNTIKNQNGVILNLILSKGSGSLSSVEIPEDCLKPSGIHHHPLVISYSYEATILSSAKNISVMIKKFHCESATEMIDEVMEGMSLLAFGVFNFSLEEMFLITETTENLAKKNTTTKVLRIPA